MHPKRKKGGSILRSKVREHPPYSSNHSQIPHRACAIPFHHPNAKNWSNVKAYFRASVLQSLQCCCSPRYSAKTGHSPPLDRWFFHRAVCSTQIAFLHFPNNYCSCPLVLRVHFFHNHRRSTATAVANCSQSVSASLLLQDRIQGTKNPCTRGPEGMPHRNSTTVHIGFF